MATKTKKTLEKELAKLESINDQLVTEISYVDNLMKMIGFAGGLVSLKETANELYSVNNGEITEDLEESYDDEGEEQVG